MKKAFQAGKSEESFVDSVRSLVVDRVLLLYELLALANGLRPLRWLHVFLWL